MEARIVLQFSARRRSLPCNTAVRRRQPSKVDSAERLAIRPGISRLSKAADALQHTLDELKDQVRRSLADSADHGPADRPAVLIVGGQSRDEPVSSRDPVRSYRIESALDGEEGYRKAREMLPDLILSDVMMPTRKRRSDVRALRAIGDRRRSIVMLTAKAEDDLRIRMLREGARTTL